MRDAGLNEAIRAAGGVSQLAEKIGISQPSVSNWHKIPAERVLTVETVTGVQRSTLRPDLYPAPARQIDEVDEAHLIWLKLQCLFNHMDKTEYPVDEVAGIGEIARR